MSCFSLQREELASMIPFPHKLSKINKWKKLFRRNKKRYARNAHRSYALVYLDELYHAQPNNSPVQVALVHNNKQAEIGKGFVREADEGVMGETGTGEVINGTRVREVDDEEDDVDLRAEIFIRKFKEEMRKQREVN